MIKSDDSAGNADEEVKQKNKQETDELEFEEFIK